MKTPFLISLLFACALTSWASAAGSAPAQKPLRIVLVSGAETYKSDEAFAGLADYLRKEHGMQCEVLTFSEDKSSIVGIEKLLAADTAVFHVRRKTLNSENLAVLKQFFSSGKGFVALRSTSHGWENWKDFDREILGARYGGPGGNNLGNAEKLNFKPHPIWKGAEGLDTKKDVYRISDVAADINVILEAETRNGRGPVAWTRPLRGGGRMFYMALFYELDQLPFRRAIANALEWVTEPSRAQNAGAR